MVISRRNKGGRVPGETKRPLVATKTCAICQNQGVAETRAAVQLTLAALTTAVSPPSDRTRSLLPERRVSRGRSTTDPSSNRVAARVYLLHAQASPCRA